VRKITNFVLKTIIALTIVCCANRGTPTGGEIDEIPPSIIKSTPENYTVNFNSKEVRVYFDEYIKFKNLQKYLIISPPIDPAPEITPLGTASKYLEIKFQDSLQPNSTYVFNFGESIVDNNADNVFSNYKYVLSTGKYIDSLKINGSLKDALERITSEEINVMLYEVDSTTSDSIIYKSKPKYITKLVDSTGQFSLENLKRGKYLLIALKEENTDYIYQNASDKIAFYSGIISLPKDSGSYNLKLFKENLDFKFSRPKQSSKNSISFGFDGELEDYKINLISTVEESFSSKVIMNEAKDTLYYWHNSNKKLDSLLFEVKNNNFIDTLSVKLRNQEIDSLKIIALQNNYISFLDNILFQANTPFNKIDETKISITNKDSLDVEFNVSLDTFKNTYIFQFNKQEEESYNVKFLPRAFTDFYNFSNDTLSYSYKTKTYDDYGNLRLILRNVEYPAIVHLTTRLGEVKYEKIITSTGNIDFKHIVPGKYYVRVILDRNKNKKFDSGNYLLNSFPERVSHLDEELDIRAGWDIVQEFILK
tara:strand:+ start:986 stop:2590 length:1605 start_codon:yes stop_codon:yes gene_type:complete